MELSSIGSPVLWGAFLGFVVVMLALDLGVFHRTARVVRAKEAAIWTAIWVGLSLLFNAWIWLQFGGKPAIEFFTGYVIEKSLSVDNIFVFVLIFAALKIPLIHQHRVLFWGILTALVLRATMIFAGVAMLARFHWLIYVFGAFLLITGIKLLVVRESTEEQPQDGLAMRWIRRLIPSTPELHGARFFVRERGRLLATPLFVALLLVEFSDVVFALDSIPAIFGVTRDPFIVFTSNIFAILGLRTLFFLLADMVERFRHLKVGLAAVLAFVGAKMLVADWIEVAPHYSLIVIVGILSASVTVSLVRSRPEAKPVEPPAYER